MKRVSFKASKPELTGLVERRISLCCVCVCVSAVSVSAATNSQTVVFFFFFFLFIIPDFKEPTTTTFYY